ncbi:MAG: DUF305 domain-containing protein [Chloroflexota bacterium]|nr:DUF305 domain-containing protein [Chloroflexota bacterium]
MKMFRGVLALLALLVVVAAVPAAMADAPVEGRIGRAELRFMEGMIDHHQMAIDMALDCLAREDVSDTLRTECQAVIDSQQPEIEQMQGWLLAWYNVDYAPMPMSDMMGMMGDDMAGMEGMEGMPATDPAMMMGMFAGFNRLEGTDYEVAWLESMTDHHDDAIHMSERLLERDADSAAHAELRDLAQQIIDAQTEEIARYEDMLTTMSAG